MAKTFVLNGAYYPPYRFAGVNKDELERVLKTSRSPTQRFQAQRDLDLERRFPQGSVHDRTVNHNITEHQYSNPSWRALGKKTLLPAGVTVPRHSGDLMSVVNEMIEKDEQERELFGGVLTYTLMGSGEPDKHYQFTFQKELVDMQNPIRYEISQFVLIDDELIDVKTTYLTPVFYRELDAMQPYEFARWRHTVLP